MAWARFDDEFDDDPELDLIGPVAACLFVCSVTWSNRNLTDGFVPRARASKLTGGTPAAIAALVRYRWWMEAEDGFQIRSYLKYNPSAVQVAETRESANERQRRRRVGRRLKDGGADDGCHGVNHGVSHAGSHGVEGGGGGVGVTVCVTPSPESGVRIPESKILPLTPSDGLGMGRGDVGEGGSAGMKPAAKWPSAVAGDMTVCGVGGDEVVDAGEPHPNPLLGKGRAPECGQRRLLGLDGGRETACLSRATGMAPGGDGREVIPPGMDEVRVWFEGEGMAGEASRFFAYYASVGWVVGKARSPMKSWTMAARGWVSRERQYRSASSGRDGKSSVNGNGADRKYGHLR